MAQVVRGSERRGPGFPLSRGREGYFPRRNSEALRQSSIMMILGTSPGERVGQPEFGSRLRELVFEPNDDILLIQIKDAVITALQRWDPLIDVQNVHTEQGGDAITIFVDYVDLANTSREIHRSTVLLRRGA